jgi:hypothetical protein
MQVELTKLDLFEELAMQLRKNIVENLNDCLKNTNLSATEKESICGEFLSEFSVNLDQGEMQHHGKYYRPVMCFIEGNNLQLWDESCKLLMPYQAYHHHDKVWDEVEELFEKANQK